MLRAIEVRYSNMKDTESERRLSGNARANHIAKRDARAKHAKTTINKTIPALLRSNPRARRGIGAVELVVDPPPLSAPASASSDSPQHSQPIITLSATTTLAAAASFAKRNSDASDNKASLKILSPRVAILNMASPLRPGGGVLSGASSQEEYLCTRTTLLPSLHEHFYRLPEIGGINTPDVLVFGSDGDGVQLPKAVWFYVDVVTAAMLRFPEVEDGRYTEEKDREMVERKMRAVMRMLRARGAQRVVLGAWGCGAYGNPVEEVARMWKKVLMGGKRGKGESWEGLEVIFAIKDVSMARRFKEAWGDGLDVEDHSAGETCPTCEAADEVEQS